jgi:hypothetical protein
MLLRVRRTWVEGVLDDSLHGAALQALGLEERPDAVPDNWNMVLQELDRPARHLAPETSIVQVFDDADVDGELLILGEPGAGSRLSARSASSAGTSSARNGARRLSHNQPLASAHTRRAPITTDEYTRARPP